MSSTFIFVIRKARQGGFKGNQLSKLYDLSESSSRKEAINVKKLTNVKQTWKQSFVRQYFVCLYTQLKK
jgi:hypothetical protein